MISLMAGVSAPHAAAQDVRQVSQHAKDSTLAVDTVPYGEIITALSVTERGRTLIAYDVANARALPFFQQYVNYLAAIDVEALNRDEQLAYWLNTRNILLIQALAEEGRVRRFKSKRGTPDAPGDFWTETRIEVSGTPLSLHDIEHKILFANWDDPNIIFGLYQGNRGGPALPRQAFTGESVKSQLAEAGRRFTALPSNFRVRNNSVRISTYFDWYLQSAFNGDETALRQHLANFADQDQRSVVTAASELKRRKLSTDFEQYKVRQATSGAGSGASGVRSSGGFGS